MHVRETIYATINFGNSLEQYHSNYLFCIPPYSILCLGICWEYKFRWLASYTGFSLIILLGQSEMKLTSCVFVTKASLVL